jgi:transposase
MARGRKVYPPEFKRRMVELVRAGRSPESLAKEFEPSANTIRKWVVQVDLDEGVRADGLTTAERKVLRELRRKVKQMELEKEILGSCGLVRKGVDYASEAYGFVKANQAHFPVATMCRVLEVSRSGYYA